MLPAPNVIIRPTLSFHDNWIFQITGTGRASIMRSVMMFGRDANAQNSCWLKHFSVASVDPQTVLIGMHCVRLATKVATKVATRTPIRM